MSRAPRMNRRAFLASAAAAGGALALGFDIPLGPRTIRASESVSEITVWIVIEPDDTVIIRVAKSEMGQGSFTALPMLVAEELECDWNKVKAEFASPHENRKRNRAWGNMSTGASRSITASQNDLRRAGATARELLIAAAAAAWNVPAKECIAANSVITHGPSGRTTTFGRVAAEAADMAPPAQIRLKDPKDWKLIGTRQRRLDVPDKVTGKPIYAIDVHLPGMLYAAIVQCPVFKGTLRSVDEAELAGMKGIRRVVKLPDAVAVVADSWWRAKKAAEALSVTWDFAGLCRRFQRHNSRAIACGPGCGGCTRRSQRRRRRPRPWSSGQADRSGLRGALPRPRHHGAAKLHGARDARPGRNLGAHAGRRNGPCHRCGRRRRVGRQGRGQQDDAGLRLRPARDLPGFRAAGGLDRERGQRAGEARLDPRGGHAPRLLSAGGERQDDRRSRCRWDSDRVENPHVRPVHHRGGLSPRHAVRGRSQLSPGPAGRHALPRAELSRGFRHAQYACARRRLAQRQPLAERVLQGKLRRRDGVCRGSRPLSVQAHAAGTKAEGARGARRRRQHAPSGAHPCRRACFAALRCTIRKAASVPRSSRPRSTRMARCACTA